MKNSSYCAFLRGVNVKGTNMKMADVCTVFEKAGMKNVSSVLASGNIIFSSDKDKEELKALLEKAMSTNFNYEAFLFVKDKLAVESVCKRNPFDSDAAYHLYGFVGIEGIENILMRAFERAEKAAGEEAQIVNDNFYWKVAKGSTLGTEFSKILGRKNLKDSFTSRNLNTFEKVWKKM